MVHNLRSSQVKSEIGPYTEWAKRNWRGRQNLQIGRWRFNKQVNLLTRLVLGSCKMRRSSHSPTRTLKVYTEGLNCIQSHILSRCLNTTLFSRLCHWNSSIYGNSGQNAHSMSRGGYRNLLLPRSSLQENQQSHPLNNFLQQHFTVILGNIYQKYKYTNF